MAGSEVRGDSDSRNTFLCDGAVKFCLGGCVRVEEIVPDSSRAFAVDDFQRPLRVLKPVDLDIDSDAAVGEGAAAQRIYDRWGAPVRARLTASTAGV